MSAPVPYIGSRITLITNKNIRYEGILVHIDPNESTVSLNQVRAFGTEERVPVDGVPVAPTNEIYDYIIFRSSDIKDLTVSELPGSTPAASAQRAPSDPAIVQQPQAGLYSPFAGQPQQQQPGQQQFNQWQQYGMMNPWGMNMNPAMYYQLLQQQQYQMQMQQMQAQQQRQAQTPNAGAPATAPAAAAPVQAAPAASPAPAAAAPAKEAPKQAAPAPTPAPTKQATPAPTAAPAPAPAKQQQQQNTPVGGQKVTPAAAAAVSGRDPKNPWGARGGSAAASSATTHQAQSQARPQGQTQSQRPQQASQPSQAAARPTTTSSAPVGGVRSYAGAATRGGSTNTFHRQTAHTGRFPSSRPGAPQRTTLPSDFDFEAANKKFDKEKIEAEIEAEAKTETEEEAYNKDDFFDRLSCEALEKLQVDVDGEAKTDRGVLAEQRKKDSETFGVTAVRNQYYSNAHQGGNYYASSNQSRGGSTAAAGSNRGRGGYSSAPSSRGGRPAGASGGSQNSNWRNVAASGSSNNTRGGHRGGRGGHSNNQGHQNNGQQKVFRPVQRNQGEAVKS